MLSPGDGLDSVSPDLIERTREQVRDWQGFVFELVRSEASEKRTTARLASLGVNGAGLTVMLAVFIQTGGLTGAEVAIAGGTRRSSQKVLEAIFGDQAVRALAAKAREELLEAGGAPARHRSGAITSGCSSRWPGARCGGRLEPGGGELESAR